MIINAQNIASLAFLTLLSLSLINLSTCIQDASNHNSETDDLTIGNEDRSYRRRSHARRHHGHHTNSNGDIVEPRHRNFLLTDYLADGELERRINYNGVTAKETSIASGRYVLCASFIHTL